MNVVREGTYDLVLNVNNGKKNDPIYDSSPRTGGLYIDDGAAIPLSFAITDTWGNASKQGVWVQYTLQDIVLTAGQHTITIRAEGENPGNFNLDYLQFNRHDTSTDAFSQIEAEKATFLSEGIEKNLESITATVDGAYAQFNELRGDNKGAITLRVNSSTGGSIIVYENGVGDKTLATISLPNDGEWHEITVDCLDTDATDSNIYIAFRALDDQALNATLDWFSFVRKIDAFGTVDAVSAAETESEIKVNSTYLGNIYDGRWAKYEDLDFGDGGLRSLLITASSHPAAMQGGVLSVYFDAMTAENKFGEVIITDTGSWNTKQTFIGDCNEITGIHDVYFVFNTSSKQAICDFYSFAFSIHTLTVQSKVSSVDGNGTTTVSISNNMAEPGDTVTFLVTRPTGGYAIESVGVKTTSGSSITLKTIIENSTYSFVLPNETPVTIEVYLGYNMPSVGDNTLLELEDGTGDSDDGKLRVDTEWAGFTGTGYVAGFKTTGSYVQIRVQVEQDGVYILALRGAAGKKNSSAYDSTPRTGALYIDGNKTEDFELAIQDSWGTWIEYDFKPVALTEGEHVFLLASEGNTNPGNFNLDSLTVTRTDGDVPAQDKSSLEMLIDQVEALNEDDYTAESWQALQDKLDEAKAVLASETATQDEVDAITTQLRTAKNALVEADDPVDPSDPGNPENPDNPQNPGDSQTEEPAGGCSGAAFGSGAAGALILIGVTALVLSHKKKQG